MITVAQLCFLLYILNVLLNIMNDSTAMSSCPQVKFNQALADHSMSDKPRLIDGIVLTKFDTIDDKVFFFSSFFSVPISLIM